MFGRYKSVVTLGLGEDMYRTGTHVFLLDLYNRAAGLVVALASGGSNIASAAATALAAATTVAAASAVAATAVAAFALAATAAVAAFTAEVVALCSTARALPALLLQQAPLGLPRVVCV